jgi:hypothetical protein
MYIGNVWEDFMGKEIYEPTRVGKTSGVIKSLSLHLHVREEGVIKSMYPATRVWGDLNPLPCSIGWTSPMFF